jgi:hypothetical protein
MDEYESLSHTKWERKYHVVFIPKCRRKTLFGQLRQHLGEVFHRWDRFKQTTPVRRKKPQRPALFVVHPQVHMAHQPWKQGTHKEKMANLHPERRNTLEHLLRFYIA